MRYMFFIYIMIDTSQNWDIHTHIYILCLSLKIYFEYSTTRKLLSHITFLFKGRSSWF